MNLRNIQFERYSINVLSVVNENLYCLLCSSILKDPYQAPCGCRFCCSCITDYLKDNDQICPGNSEECFELKLNFDKDIRVDSLAKREINKLIVKCPLISCNEEYEFRVMKDHIKSCAAVSIICESCFDNVTRENYDDHVVNECKEKIINCEFCNTEIKRGFLKENHHNFHHENLCELYSNYCPNGCEELSKVVWIEHRRVCSNRQVSCPYQSIGCNSKDETLKSISQHINDKGFEHAEVLLKHIDNLNNEIAYLKNERTKSSSTKNESGIASNDSHIYRLSEMMSNTSVQDEISEMKRNCDNLCESNRKMVQEMIDFKARINMLEYTSCNNGVALIWKIRNFTQVHTSDSPDFYSCPRGYKFSLTLEKRIRGYLSIYAAVKCGEFDDDLEWPIRKRIIIKILDQERQNRDYDQNLDFKTNANYCKRKYEHDVLRDYGIPEFIPYQTLRDKPYLLKDNNLWIECRFINIP